MELIQRQTNLFDQHCIPLSTVERWKFHAASSISLDLQIKMEACEGGAGMHLLF